jgi:alginate O-acetyltransferase complex protein AlgI
MPFLSLTFATLLVAALVTFHTIPLAVRRPYLLALSYAFYSTWGVAYLPILLAATALAWFVGPRVALGPGDLEPTPRARRCLWLSLAAFIGLLFSFKYLPAISPRLAIAAPLGISYYTFRLISYLVDIHWGNRHPERDFVAFALYVAFFPQIVSGPIQRPDDFLQQIHRPRPVRAEFLVSGMRLILFGIFKKLVVANRLALIVTTVFDAPQKNSGAAFLVGAYAFALQLYADFSGITDIAIGIGRLFGVESPANFNNPFYAPNIQAFWQRWHMSLTAWISDYLYNPLRMAVRNYGQAGLVGAILINMLAVGLWHGGRWTFVMFGALNGIYMAVSALTLKRRNKMWKGRLTRLRAAGGALVTFHLVVFALILFRAATIHDAAFIFRRLVPSPSPGWGLKGIGLNVFGAPGLVAVVVMEVVHLTRASGTLRRALEWSPTWLRWSAYYATAVAVILFGQLGMQSFIYARF